MATGRINQIAELWRRGKVVRRRTDPHTSSKSFNSFQTALEPPNNRRNFPLRQSNFVQGNEIDRRTESEDSQDTKQLARERTLETPLGDRYAGSLCEESRRSPRSQKAGQAGREESAARLSETSSLR